MLDTTQQFIYVFEMALSGMIVGFIYDIFKIFRSISSKRIWFFYDLLFCILAYSVIQFYFYLSAAGAFRILALACCGIGILIYKIGLSNLFLKLQPIAIHLKKRVMGSKLAGFLFK